jgi:hypothetical protein
MKTIITVLVSVVAIQFSCLAGDIRLSSYVCGTGSTRSEAYSRALSYVPSSATQINVTYEFFGLVKSTTVYRPGYPANYPTEPKGKFRCKIIFKRN